MTACPLEDLLRAIGALRLDDERLRTALRELGERRLALVEEFATDGCIYDRVYEQWRCRDRRLVARWPDLGRAGNYKALWRAAHEVRSGRGAVVLGRVQAKVGRRGSRALGESEEQVRAVLAKLVGSVAVNAPVTALHRLLEVECEERGWPAPGLAWTRGAVDALRRDAGVATYLAEGVKGLRARGPHISLDRESLLPGEEYVVDHRVADVEVVSTSGELVRPWITMVVDHRTMVPLGWGVLPMTPNADSLLAVLTSAMLPKGVTSRNSVAGPLLGSLCGIPDRRWVFDNGQDFRDRRLAGEVKRFLKGSDALVGFDGEALGLSGETGARVRYCMAYNARAKVAERWFRDMSQQFDAVLPGAVGPDAKSIPDATRRRRDAWKRLVKSFSREELRTEAVQQELAARTGYLTLARFGELFEEWLWTWAAREDSRAAGLQHNGRVWSPLALWGELAGPRVVPTAERLGRLAMGWDVRTVAAGGELLFRRRRYASATLERLVGKRVMVRFDKEDAGYLLVDQIAGEGALAEALRIPAKGLVDAHASDEAVGELIELQKRQQKAELGRVRGIVDPAAGEGPAALGALEKMLARQNGKVALANVSGVPVVGLVDLRDLRGGARSEPAAVDSTAAEDEYLSLFLG